MNFNKYKKSKDGYQGYCKQCNDEYYKEWYKKNSKRVISKNKIYQQKNRDTVVARECVLCNNLILDNRKVYCDDCFGSTERDNDNLLAKLRNKLSRINIINHYSNGTNKCCLCGNDNINVLCINHINGGGRKQFKKLNKCGASFYKWLKKQKYPIGFNVLCWNCNFKHYLNMRFQKRDNPTIYTIKGFNLKVSAIQVYSDYEMKCSLCDEDDIDVLTIDHMDGNGKSHRKKMKTSLYDWLRKESYPDGFRVLCQNCNHLERLRLKGHTII